MTMHEGQASKEVDIAIYDLDETLTKRATFTPFLIHAAQSVAPWRLALLPVWVLAMVLHKAGLYGRTGLKTFGMRLMVGRRGADDLRGVADSFAASRTFLPGAVRAVEADLARGVRVIVATAAFDFYARPIAQRLGIAEVVGSEWDGRGIPGGNCYAGEKFARVTQYLADVNREAVRVRMVSDSRADGPLLDWADEAWFVGPRDVSGCGWEAKDFSR